MFFFEKKNQKTFATLVRNLAPAPGSDTGRKAQKFFGSFFQKRTSLLLPYSHRNRRRRAGIPLTVIHLRHQAVGYGGGTIPGDLPRRRGGGADQRTAGVEFHLAGRAITGGDICGQRNGCTGAQRAAGGGGGNSNVRAVADGFLDLLGDHRSGRQVPGEGHHDIALADGGNEF